jgi:hypothetical protein
MSIVEVLAEEGRRAGRDVTYRSGAWDQVKALLPTFDLTPFNIGPGEPANPYLRTVVRKPQTLMERPIPVGVVSTSYSLVQHAHVGEVCLSGMRKAGVDISDVRCEVGLSEFGEWMNLRLYFPDAYSFTPPDQNKLSLRVEAFNSVDGSSRLTVLLSWLRLICLNGMVIKESVTEIRDVHNSALDLDRIESAILLGTLSVQADKEQLELWQSYTVSQEDLEDWIDNPVAERWGKKAACRVLHICNSGYDVELVDPFQGGPASQKMVQKTERVPGAPAPAANLYDVSQALSWVASGRRDPEERIARQSDLPSLMRKLAARRVSRSFLEA